MSMDKDLSALGERIADGLEVGDVDPIMELLELCEYYQEEYYMLLIHRDWQRMASGARGGRSAEVVERGRVLMTGKNPPEMHNLSREVVVSFELEGNPISRRNVDRYLKGFYDEDMSPDLSDAYEWLRGRRIPHPFKIADLSKK